MRKLVITAAGTILAGAFAFAAPVLADDGGAMQRLMGHEAYGGMVDQMRGVLGEERANQMLAHCEAEMASHEIEGSGVMGGMMQMQEMGGGD